MHNFSRPSGLAPLSQRYDAILCDVWGVIHNGRKAFQPACEALVAFRNRGGTVVLITNAPVPKERVLRYFAPLGVPDEAFDDCVSSGDAARAELLRRKDQTVWVYGADAGEEHDRFLYEGLGLTFEPSAAADILLCIGLRDQVNDDPEDYRSDLREIAAAGLPMLCANPDIQVRVGDQLVWCAGALARIYEQEGGVVIYPGKPHAAIYRLARERLVEHGFHGPDGRILAVGDGPVTDLRGANREGLDVLYVGSGLAAGEAGDFDVRTRQHLAEAGVSATYAMPELFW